MNREFLQLAREYEIAKHCIGGYFVSEKYDGMLAYWDGGFTRGQLTSKVWFANSLKDKESRVSTGLWSRYGKPIHAPEWFLNLLPIDLPLVGELYLGRGHFQETMSIVKRHDSDGRWENIKYLVFDIANDEHMFVPGKINNPNFTLQMTRKHIPRLVPTLPFHQSIKYLEKAQIEGDHIKLAPQERLPMSNDLALKSVRKKLEKIVDVGGEGLMLRKPENVWYPKRTEDVLKVVKYYEGEATVEGYKDGKGKHEGRMGSLIVVWEGKTFDVSGFTDSERETVNKNFPIGATIKFKYKDLSDSGIPKHANYLR